MADGANIPAIAQFNNPFQGLGQGGGGVEQRGVSVPQQVDPLARGMDVYNNLTEADQRKQALEMEKLKYQQQVLKVEGDKRANAYFMSNFDPESGQINEPKLFADLSSDPLTVSHGMEMYQFVTQNGNMRAETANKILMNQREKSNAMGKQAFSLWQTAQENGENVSRGAASAVISDWVSRGWMTPEEGQHSILNMPSEGPKLNAEVKKIAMQAEQSAQANDAMIGQIQNIDTGNAVVTQRVGTDGVHVQQVLPKGLSPDQASEMVEVPDGKGGTIQMPRSQALEVYKNGPGSASPGGAPDGMQLGRTPSAAEQEAAKIQVTDDADYKKTTLGQGEAGQMNLGSLSIAERAMKNIKSGGGADWYLFAGKLAEGLGADKDTVNKISNRNLGDSETVQSLNDLLSLQHFRSITGQPNRDLAQKEYERIAATGFSLTNTPEANKRILEFYKGLSKMDVKKSQAMTRWLDPEDPTYKKSHTISSFRKAWDTQAYKLIRSGILNGGTPVDEHGNYVSGDKQ